MAEKVRSKLTIDAMAQIWKEGDQSVAHAMPLAAMSAGATPEEARRALGEAVRLFLRTAAEAGTLGACYRGPAMSSSKTPVHAHRGQSVMSNHSSAPSS